MWQPVKRSPAVQPRLSARVSGFYAAVLPDRLLSGQGDSAAVWQQPSAWQLRRAILAKVCHTGLRFYGKVLQRFKPLCILDVRLGRGKHGLHQLMEH